MSNQNRDPLPLAVKLNQFHRVAEATDPKEVQWRRFLGRIGRAVRLGAAAVATVLTFQVASDRLHNAGEAKQERMEQQVEGVDSSGDGMTPEQYADYIKTKQADVAEEQAEAGQ